MIKKLFPHIFACILLFLNMSFSQYPDTLWMPVTFYDYQTHPHAHNPDFEACLGAHSGMIHDTLSSLGKPILLKDYGCNDHVEEWFWPSAIGSNAQYNFVTHRYESGVVARPNPNEFVGVGYDSTYDMSNIVIYDSLPFIHLGNGLYEYVNYNFFPLDGIGYGEEGRTHNYGFAMELHTKFKYRPGITFFFRGDDDAWAFINGNLEMDLGGIHQQSVDGSVNVDTLGLATGQDYDFDFFYAERHTKNSSIRITTNIISTHLVTELTIEAVPSVAMLPAGDTISYTGTVWYDSTDANGVIHHKPDSILSQNITWSYSSNNHLSDPAKTSLLPTLGSQSIFTSTQAFEIFTITASYEDPITSEITTATAVITIVAGPPDHLVLEQIPDTTDIDILQSDQPLDTLIIEEYQSSRNAYAILRDQYGNFSNYSQNTDWTILSGSVLSSVASGSSALGEGVVTKYGSSGIGTISGQDLDSTGESYIDTCVVLVRNEAPTSTNDYYSTQEDVVLIVPGPGKANILDNDTDPDPLANLTAILVDDVSHGLLNLNADGSFTYMPPVDFNGTVQFTYKCYDNEFYSNVATVTIIVGVNNDPPTANNDNYSTNEDTPLNVTAPGLLSNDNDVDGDTLTAILVEAVDPLKGTLLLNSDGSFLFTPIAHFNGTATFTYQAFDGMVNSNLAAVTITVNPINDLPVANNDQYSTNEDNTLTVSSPGVLINDYDVDNDSLSDSIISNVSNGTLLLNPNGSFTYTPNANFNGNDSFTYLISDSYGTSNTATVTIVVNPVNDLPTAVNDNYAGNEDEMLTVAVNGILNNDSDPDGDSLTVHLICGIDSSKGILILNTNGSFTFTPVANYNGTAFFTYQIYDGTGYSNVASCMLFINPVNDTSVAHNDAYGTAKNNALNVSASGVLENDVDIDGDALIAELVTGIDAAVEGELTLNSDGSFTYVPKNNYTGSFTFTYKAKDDSIYSNISTVTIYVGYNNSPPAANNDSYSISEDNTLTVNPSGVLSNDSDPDLDGLDAMLITDVDVTKGSLTFNGDGSFVFIPKSNFNGIATFTYQASDSQLLSNTATVTITVTPQNDVPVAHNDYYTVDEDVTLNVPGNGKPGVINNDVDGDGDQLTAFLVSDVDTTKGTLSLSTNGSFIYIPKSHNHDTVYFTYKITDGTDTSSAAATVTITVNSINDAPVLTDIPDQTITKGETFSAFDLDGYVSDVDHTDAEITFTNTSGTQLSVNIDPVTHIVSISILDTSWVGSETIVFTATDPNSLFSTDSVTFTMNNMIRLPMPETDTLPGTYIGKEISMNLYVPNYSSSDIEYTFTTDGTTPENPKTGTPQVINGSDVVSFGPFTEDTTNIKVLAYSKHGSYENSENRLFEYTIILPQLPLPEANPGAGQYDTSVFTITLSVPGHSNADIYYTTDGSDPETSPTKIYYNFMSPINLGIYNQVTYETLKIFTSQEYYQSSTAIFEYVFNPSGLPKPVADPPGHTFSTDSVLVSLSVPNYPDVVIRYTTDGAMPDLNSSLYAGALTINKNTTLKAIAIKDDSIPGPVMVEYYVQSLPASIKIFPDISATQPYVSTNSCQAGISFPMIAKIFDQYDTCLTQYSISTAPISWEIEELTGVNTGELMTNSGYSNQFTPLKAHNTIKIKASFSENGKEFSTEIIIIITPGNPYKVWLEPDYDWHVSPNQPNPVDSIWLSAKQSTSTIYAVIRDSLGNWAMTSKMSAWNSMETQIATVIPGYPDHGEARLQRGSTIGNTVVTGENTNLNLTHPKDSVVVVSINYWYDSLKIVVNGSIAYPIDTLVFNTNIDTTISVFGHRDDGGTPAWEKVSSRWELLDKSIEYIIASPPNLSHSYFLSPNDTASGRIRVTFGDDATTVPDTVHVIFTPGGPVRASFTLLTPSDSCFAGDTLQTVIKLYNSDNKIIYGINSYPGNGGDSTFYNDIIPDGGKPLPFFITTINKFILNNNGSYAHQIIQDGIDTVQFVLYNAPAGLDSLHQLSVTLNDTITAKTRLFRLLANTLSSIEISVDTTIADTVVLYSNSGTLIKSIGYDTYGNVIDVVLCNWSTTGDIPPILYPNNTKQIYYSIESITEVTTGTISAISTQDSTISDTVYIIINPSPSKLVRALTRDINGNGYLDAVELLFDKGTILPATILDNNSLSLYHVVNGDTIDILIDSIVPSKGNINTKDSSFTLFFTEHDSNNEPQTDWLPLITLGSIPDVTEIPLQKCSDGAPPVVWEVIKITDPGGDFTKDKIEITLSESFINPDGSVFTYAGKKPETIFNIWIRTGNNFTLVEDKLKGIPYFSQMEDKKLTFFMVNDENITSNHYVNLVYQDSPIADRAYNTPAENNQKVKVYVEGAIKNVTVGPNPIIPTYHNHETEKLLPLMHVNPEQAFTKIKTHGGAIISVDVAVNSDYLQQNTLQISGQLFIFDAVGNLVFKKSNSKNVLPDDWKKIISENEMTSIQLVFYWDGISERGMKASPGVYRTIVFLKYGRNIYKAKGSIAVGR